MQALTKQERKFVEIKARTGNGTQAAKKAFGIKNTGSAAVRATRVLKDAKIVSALEKALPDELLFKTHREGLQAKQFRFSPDGELMQLDDFNTRSKYLDMAYKLKGDYAPEKSLNVNVEMQPTPDMIEAAAQFDEQRYIRAVDASVGVQTGAVGGEVPTEE